MLLVGIERGEAWGRVLFVCFSRVGEDLEAKTKVERWASAGASQAQLSPALGASWVPKFSPKPPVRARFTLFQTSSL